MSNKRRGIPFVVSGPSGAGKTTLYKKAVDFLDGLRHSISCTTRPARAGEVDGVDYHFVTDAEFDRMVKAGDFLEYSGVHGRKYGTGRAELEKLLDSGVDVMLEIDVQGAEKVKKAMEGVVYVFVIPPSIEACRERLTDRGKDTEDEITRRVNIAIEEIKKAPGYDYIIVNDDFDRAFDELRSVIVAERVRKERMMPRVKDLLGVS